jgi:hypothetical protein
MGVGGKSVATAKSWKSVGVEAQTNKVLAHLSVARQPTNPISDPLASN